MKRNIEFPVDAVYTWVDGHDDRWQQRKAKALNQHDITDTYSYDVARCRFVDNDELKFSLRSLEKFAPWINHVYIVTDSQTPSWINPERVTIVDHKLIFPCDARLPSFNSHAIELCLHNIKGLTEHFLYFNDDFILGRNVYKKDFYLNQKTALQWVAKRSNSYIKTLLSKSFFDLDPHKAGEARSRQLIYNQFHSYPPYSLRHYPRAIRRSLAYEVVDIFKDAVRSTLLNQFRSVNDIAMHVLYALYAIESGKDKPRIINGVNQLIDTIRLRPLHLGASVCDPKWKQKLTTIRYLKPLTYCLNDGTQATDHGRMVLRNFLQDMLPMKSTYEL